MTEISSLADVRPGDIMFTDITGAPGLGVYLGQKILRESFQVGRLRVCHVGIVVKAPKLLFGPTEVIPGRLVQAMPRGAEEIEMTAASHWTPWHAYVRLPEDYPGQAADAAAIARLMVAEGVAYSPLSYVALAAWQYGLKTPRLEKWINRRRPFQMIDTRAPLTGGRQGIALPVEAICSVLVDQCWSLAGKRVMEGTVPQVVTPGGMAGQLWRRAAREGIVWGGAGFLGREDLL